MKVYSFTKGKSSAGNEDAIGYNEHTWVVCDGSTDKYNNLYSGKRGGEIAAQLVLQQALKTNKNGRELADHATDKLTNLYREINPEALNDPQARFATTLVCARLIGDKLHVTQVGDTTFRINGTDDYFNNKKIDELTSDLRARYIRLTDDVAGSRNFILPLLQKQLQYSNNPNHPLGYGVIDGTKLPGDFVRTFEFPRKDVHTLEIATDGYYTLPKEATVEAYEQLHDQVEKEDPDKYKKYPSTKSKDDRSVLIVNFKKSV